MKNCASVIGSIVTVTVDRPMGSVHPKHRDIFYPINYGYVEGSVYSRRGRADSRIYEQGHRGYSPP